VVPEALNQGPVIAPAMQFADQPPVIDGTFGFVFKLTSDLKIMLVKKRDGKVPMVLNINSSVQTPDGSRTIVVKALVYWDPINTRDMLNNNIMAGYLGEEEKQKWRAGLTFLHRRGVAGVWLKAILRRLAGEVVDPEPIFWTETGIPHDPLWQLEVERIRNDQQGQQQLGQQQEEACRQMPLTPPTSSPRPRVPIAHPKPAIQEAIERPQLAPNIQSKSAIRPPIKAAPDRQQIEAIRARQEQNRIAGNERTQPTQRIQGQIAHSNPATGNETAQAQPNHAQGHIIHNTPVIQNNTPQAQPNHAQGHIIHNTPTFQNKTTQAKPNQVQGKTVHNNPAIRSEAPQAQPNQARQPTAAQTEATRLIKEEANLPQNRQRFVEFLGHVEVEYRRNVESDPQKAEQIRVQRMRNAHRQLHTAAIARINAQRNSQQMAPQANKRKTDWEDRLEDSKRTKTATDSQ
jgi:hypothetical protein